MRHPFARDPIEEFNAAAERYVALVEDARGRGQEQLLADFTRVLPGLYEAAVPLPSVRPETEGLPERGLTHDQWEQVCDRLRGRLGSADRYRTGAPLLDEDDEKLEGSLAADLADIYRDVKDGLDLIAAGESENEVVGE